MTINGDTIIDRYAVLPLGRYLDVLALDAGGDDYQVLVLAAIYGVTPDDILDLPLTNYKAIAEASHFLAEPLPESDGRRLPQSYRLGSWTLVPTRRARDLTAAQYIDFQGFVKGGMQALPQLLSCILVPEGCRYCDGYDPVAVQDAIRDCLPVADAEALSAFFFAEIHEINRQYPGLFPPRPEGDDGAEEVQDGGDEGAAGDGGEDTGFTDRWGWVAHIDEVAEVTRQGWPAVYAMPVMEFLNIVCYCRDKAEFRRQEIDRWKRTH